MFPLRRRMASTLILALDATPRSHLFSQWTVSKTCQWSSSQRQCDVLIEWRVERVQNESESRVESDNGDHVEAPGFPANSMSAEISLGSRRLSWASRSTAAARQR